jgi:mRNA interferase MazF
MVASTYIPDRGDAVWMTFSPQAGHEQAGRRPAIVLSPARSNEFSSLAFVVPISSRSKGYAFDVAIPSGLPSHGVALVDHMKSMDWRARDIEFIGKLPEAVIQEILARLAALLPGIRPKPN